MTAAIPVRASGPDSAVKVKLASVEAREALRFRFGPGSRAVPVLFAHQNFKDDQIQWPEKLLPVDITVDVDPMTLNFLKISFDFEDAALKGASNPRETEALKETLEKCRKLVKKKVLTSHYGCQVDPVKYPGDTEIPWAQMELVDSAPDGLELFRFSSPESKELEIFWRRFEWLMLFFVDATQHTEISDPRWEYCVARLRDSGKIVLGFSMYKFPVFPLHRNSERHRIAQFLTLPSFWGQGHAEKVLDFFHQNLWRATNIDRLTLEDASEGMLALRNVVLLKALANTPSLIDRVARLEQFPGLSPERLSLRRELRANLKVSMVAIDRLIDTVLIAKKFPDFEFRDDDSGTDSWWLKTEFVKKIKWVPEEVEAMPEGEEKEDARKEFFQEEWENYVEAAFRAWKRVFKPKP